MWFCKIVLIFFLFFSGKGFSQEAFLQTALLEERYQDFPREKEASFKDKEGFFYFSGGLIVLPWGSGLPETSLGYRYRTSWIGFDALITEIWNPLFKSAFANAAKGRLVFYRVFPREISLYGGFGAGGHSIRKKPALFYSGRDDFWWSVDVLLGYQAKTKGRHHFIQLKAGAWIEPGRYSYLLPVIFPSIEYGISF